MLEIRPKTDICIQNVSLKFVRIDCPCPLQVHVWFEVWVGGGGIIQV